MINTRSTRLQPIEKGWEQEQLMIANYVNIIGYYVSQIVVITIIRTLIQYHLVPTV